VSGFGCQQYELEDDRNNEILSSALGLLSSVFCFLTPDTRNLTPYAYFLKKAYCNIINNNIWNAVMKLAKRAKNEKAGQNGKK